MCRTGFQDSMYCSTISASISSGKDTVALARFRTCLSMSRLGFSLAFSGSTFQLELNSTPGECSLYFFFHCSYFLLYFLAVTDAYGFLLSSTFLFACSGNQYYRLPWIDRTRMSGLFAIDTLFLKISIYFRISLFPTHTCGSFCPV